MYLWSENGTCKCAECLHSQICQLPNRNVGFLHHRTWTLTNPNPRTILLKLEMKSKLGLRDLTTLTRRVQTNFGGYSLSISINSHRLWCLFPPYRVSIQSLIGKLYYSPCPNDIGFHHAFRPMTKYLIDILGKMRLEVGGVDIFLCDMLIFCWTHLCYHLFSPAAKWSIQYAPCRYKISL